MCPEYRVGFHWTQGSLWTPACQRLPVRSRILEVWFTPCQGKSIVSFPKSAQYSPGRCPAPSEAVSEQMLSLVRWIRPSEFLEGCTLQGDLGHKLVTGQFIDQMQKSCLDHPGHRAPQFHLFWVSYPNIFHLLLLQWIIFPPCVVVYSTSASPVFALEEAPQWNSLIANIAHKFKE